MKSIEKTLLELIEAQGVSFIGSVDELGFPNLKAMLPPRKHIGLKEFYFTTNTSSQRVAQYKKNKKASLYFCDQHSFRGVQLLGTMDILTDAKSKQMIWQEGDTMYYPLGVTDPDYCVLKFTATAVRYYSNFKSETFILSE